MTQMAATLQRAAKSLAIAAWAAGIAAVWLASAAAIGPNALGHSIAANAVFGVPPSAFAAALGAACELLRRRVVAGRDTFGLPERLPDYPLNDPGE